MFWRKWIGFREVLSNFSFCRHCEERSDEAISKYMIYLKTRLLISPHLAFLLMSIFAILQKLSLRSQ